MSDIQIKRRLREGKTVCILSGHHNTDMIDFLGQFGPDGIWIETEHGPVTWEQIGDMTRACDLWNVASIVRVSANEPWLITRTLDRGASGIVIPHVSTKAEAEKVVESAKFGPIGLRGMYGSRRSYGVADYYQKANDETLVTVLVEEMEAVQNLDEMLTVDNIDVFFVAPSDLAQTMGYTGQPNHPEVRKVIDETIGRIAASGRTAGALVTDETFDHYVEVGARFLMMSWNNWVAQGARNLRQRLDRING